MADGKFLDAATATYPTAVLGSVAAARLAIHEVTGTQQIWLGGQWFTVIGVLDEFELLESQLKRVTLYLDSYLAKNPGGKLLMSIPGVGARTS